MSKKHHRKKHIGKSLKKKVTLCFIIAFALTLLFLGTLRLSGFFTPIKMDQYSGRQVSTGTIESTSNDSAAMNISGDTGIPLATPTKAPTPSADHENESQNDDQQKSIKTTEPNSEVVLEINDEPVPADDSLDRWLERKIEEHRDEIDDEDLDDFRAIVAKLNQRYIKTLAMDGFTGEEQDALKEHMHQRLSDKEYARAKELFYKYSYLLEELEEDFYNEGIL